MKTSIQLIMVFVVAFLSGSNSLFAQKKTARSSTAIVQQSQFPIVKSKTATDVTSEVKKHQSQLVNTQNKTASSLSLSQPQRNKLTQVSGNLAVGKFTKSTQAQWELFVKDMYSKSPDTDINALIQYTMREAYLENMEDLKFYAEKVKLFNERKEAIRDEITSARNARSKFQRDSKSTRYQKKKLAPYPSAKLVTLKGQNNALNSEPAWENYLDDLEEKLATVGDDAQLANIDLQNALQKQQQTFQTLSNVSKMLHDTAMAIIRKIG